MIHLNRLDHAFTRSGLFLVPWHFICFHFKPIKNGKGATPIWLILTGNGVRKVAIVFLIHISSRQTVRRVTTGGITGKSPFREWQPAEVQTHASSRFELVAEDEHTA